MANRLTRLSGAGAAGLHDPLTGLANWHLFADHVDAALARAARNGWSTALLVVDVDDFHEINDQFGHELGDVVLVEMARRLQAEFRPSDNAMPRETSTRPRPPCRATRPGPTRPEFRRRP